MIFLLILILVLIVCTEVLLLPSKFHSGKSKHIREHSLSFNHSTFYQPHSIRHWHRKHRKMNHRLKHPRVKNETYLPFRGRSENWQAYNNLKRIHRKMHKHGIQKSFKRIVNNPNIELSPNRAFPKGRKNRIAPSIFDSERESQDSGFSFPNSDKRKKFKVKSRDTEFDSDTFLNYGETEQLFVTTTQRAIVNLRQNIPGSGNRNSSVNAFPQFPLLNDDRKGLLEETRGNIPASMAAVVNPNQKLPAAILNMSSSNSSNAFMPDRTLTFVNEPRRLPVPSPSLAGIEQNYAVVSSNQKPSILAPSATNYNSSNAFIPDRTVTFVNQPKIFPAPSFAINEPNSFRQPALVYGMGTNFQRLPFPPESKPTLLPAIINAENINHQISQAASKDDLASDMNSTTLSSVHYVQNKIKGVASMYISLGKKQKIVAASVFAVLSITVILSSLKCYKHLKDRRKKKYPFKKNSFTLLRASKQQQKELLRRINSLKNDDMHVEEEFEN